jgi:hypothetical protein
MQQLIKLAQLTRVSIRMADRRFQAVVAIALTLNPTALLLRNLAQPW